jgi:hypothetical protein
MSGYETTRKCSFCGKRTTHWNTGETSSCCACGNLKSLRKQIAEIINDIYSGVNGGECIDPRSLIELIEKSHLLIKNGQSINDIYKLIKEAM